MNEFEIQTNVHPDQSTSPVKQSATGFKAFIQGWKQIIPLFHKPHIWNAILIFTIQFVLLLGWNTFRLWLPQIFATFSEYEDRLARNSTISKESLCSLIEADVIKSNKLYKEESVDVECNAVRKQNS